MERETELKAIILRNGERIQRVRTENREDTGGNGQVSGVFSNDF